MWPVRRSSLPRCNSFPCAQVPCGAGPVRREHRTWGHSKRSRFGSVLLLDSTDQQSSQPPCGIPKHRSYIWSRIFAQRAVGALVPGRQGDFEERQATEVAASVFPSRVQLLSNCSPYTTQRFPGEDQQPATHHRIRHHLPGDDAWIEHLRRCRAETLGRLLQYCPEFSVNNPDRRGSPDRTNGSIGSVVGSKSTHRSTISSHRRHFSKGSSGFLLQSIFVMQPTQNHPAHHFLVSRKIVSMIPDLVEVHSWLR